MTRMRRALIAATFAIFASLFVPEVLAQQAPAAAPAEETTVPMQEVVVTGSRIPVPANISATSPTTIVRARRSSCKVTPISPM